MLMIVVYLLYNRYGAAMASTGMVKCEMRVVIGQSLKTVRILKINANENLAYAA